MMNEKQKKKRLKNMEKARKAKSPPKNISIHSSIRNLPDHHPINFKKVQKWIKTNLDEWISLKKQLRIKYDSKANDRYNILDVYILNMKQYLRSGIWLDIRYGENREFKISYTTLLR